MIVLTIFLKAYWRQLVIVVALTSVLVTGYNYVYNRGYHASEVRCTEKFDAYSKNLNERIASIEVLSAKLGKDAEESSKVTSTKLTQILLAAKNKAPYVIENGKCTLSKDFTDSYNALIREGNSK